MPIDAVWLQLALSWESPCLYREILNGQDLDLGSLSLCRSLSGRSHDQFSFGTQTQSSASDISMLVSTPYQLDCAHWRKWTLTAQSLLLLLGLCSESAAQRQPRHDCSHFRYEQQGNGWIGIVTTPYPLQSIDWKLRFAARGSDSAHTVGGLNPYPNKNAAYQNMFDGQRSSSFVRFQNYGNELPKLTLVELNGQVLCSFSEYSAPSSTMTRQLRLAVSTQSTRNGGDYVPTYVQVPTQPLIYIAPPTTQEYVSPPDRSFQHNVFLNKFLNGGGSIGSGYPSSTFDNGNTFGIGSRPTNSGSRPTNSDSRPTNSGSRPTNSGSRPTNSGSTPTNSGPKPIVIVNTGSRRNSVAPDKCGVEGWSGLQHGGTDFPHGRFPWLTALYHDQDPDPNVVNLVYSCVATLISGRTVITAAHCIWGKTPDEIRIYVGRHDTDQHPEVGATIMEIESSHPHPDYTGNLVPDADMGLLVFTTHVQYSDFVRPICMWSSTTFVSAGDSNGTVVGWGIDKNGTRTRFPKAVEVNIVARDRCLHEMTSAKHFLVPSARVICAGNDMAHGPCLGDSGGGLMVNRDGTWMVRAIVSVAQRTSDNCDLSRFVIYSDVAKHLSWIEEKIVR